MKIVFFFLVLLFSFENYVVAKLTCRDGFLFIEGRCYWFSPAQLPATWIDAADYCRSMNSYLTIYSSVADDQDMTAELYLNNSLITEYWLGMTDIQLEGKYMGFSRHSREELEFKNWAKHEPNNAGVGEDCAFVAKSSHYWQWIDSHCNREKGFVCEYYPQDWWTP